MKQKENIFRKHMIKKISNNCPDKKKRVSCWNLILYDNFSCWYKYIRSGLLLTSIIKACSREIWNLVFCYNFLASSYAICIYHVSYFILFCSSILFKKRKKGSFLGLLSLFLLVLKSRDICKNSKYNFWDNSIQTNS
jgi:hypothetical protein